MHRRRRQPARAVILALGLALIFGGGWGVAGAQDDRPKPADIPPSGPVFAQHAPNNRILFKHARPDDRLYPIQIDNAWGEMNQGGRLVVYPRFQWTDRDYDHLARAVQQGKTGFIDIQGKFIIPPIYPYADRFAEGFAVVSDGQKYGIINRVNDVLFPAKLDAARRFREGYALVQVGDRMGYIDKTGQFAIKPRYAAARSFHDGFAAVRFVSEDGQPGGWGYIDKTGREVVRDDTGRIQALGDINDGLAKVRVGGQWGYLDKRFQTRIAPRFDRARDFADGVAAVRLDGLWGYINKTGDFAIAPAFARADDFGSPLAMVVKQTRRGGPDQYGFVNRVANGGIAPQFDWAQPFDRDYARVAQAPSFGYIDRSGRVIWDPREALVSFVDLRPGSVARFRGDPLHSDFLRLPPPNFRPDADLAYPPDYQYDEGLPLPPGSAGSPEALGTRKGRAS